MKGGSENSMDPFAIQTVQLHEASLPAMLKGERVMTAGQRSGTGAMTDLDDEKVRKDDILTNRDKAQRRPGQSLDGLGIEVDEYKDIPSNQRPKKGDAAEPEQPKSNATKE